MSEGVESVPVPTYDLVRTELTERFAATAFKPGVLRQAEQYVRSRLLPFLDCKDGELDVGLVVRKDHRSVDPCVRTMSANADVAEKLHELGYDYVGLLDEDDTEVNFCEFRATGTRFAMDTLDPMSNWTVDRTSVTVSTVSPGGQVEVVPQGTKFLIAFVKTHKYAGIPF